MWLCVAPVVTNLLTGSALNFLPSNTEGEPTVVVGRQLDAAPQDVTVKELLREPTRIFFAAFLLISLLNLVVMKKRIQLDKTELCMVVFSLIIVANVLLWSQRWFFSLRIAFDAFVIPFIGFYIARRIVTNEHRFTQLTRILGYVGAYLVLWGFFDRLMHGHLFYRLRGPFKTGTIFYYVMVVPLFAMVLDFVSSRRF
jgi:hypothetical protein